jgi:hypothetical protein
VAQVMEANARQDAVAGEEADPLLAKAMGPQRVSRPILPSTSDLNSRDLFTSVLVLPRVTMAK